MRKAVSLVELVFAIVIIGIAAMSFPLILTQTGSNIKIALQQEAILNAKSYAGIALSYPWDENTVSSSDGRFMVLDTTASTTANDAFNTTGDNTRVGHIKDSFGRRAVLIDGNTGLTITPTAKSDGEWGNAALDDFDDFDGQTQNLAVTLDTLDYILDFALSSTVTYVSDTLTTGNYGDQNIAFNFSTGAVGDNTNIKMVEVKAVNAARNIDIGLRAYSSNIGDYVLLEKENW